MVIRNQFLAHVKDIPEGKSLVIILPDGLEGSIVSCPWHGWEFDVTTGDCINMPCESARKIDIGIIGGKIFISCNDSH